MGESAGYISFSNTEKMIIIACLVIPFLINSIVEAFVHNERLKKIIQCVFYVPGYFGCMGVVSIWLNSNMGLINMLLTFVLFFVFWLGCQFMGEILQTSIFGENPIDSRDNPKGDAPEKTQITENKHVQIQETENTVQDVSEKSVGTRFDEAIAQSNEDEAIIYGSDLLQEGELIHVMLGFKKLADKGFSQSRELYVNLVYRLSYAQRRSQSYATWKMTLNELHCAVAAIGVMDSESIKTLKQKLKRELMCWNAIAKTQTTEGENVAEHYRTVALELLGELTVNGANDPDAQECIAFVNTMGITLTSSPKPAVPRNPPVKPSLPQTLKNCLRCGAALSGEKCNMCNLDHTKDPIRLLVKVDSRDLQISK